MLARVCYALLNKKRGESLWNSRNRLISSISEYSAICTRFSLALWKLLPVKKRVCFSSQSAPDVSLISKLPAILPLVFHHVPASAEFGSLLKNLCRVLVRCWKQGGRASEGWLFDQLSAKSVCALEAPLKQRVGDGLAAEREAFSIFVLYMMKIGFVSAQQVAEFFLGLWAKVTMQSERDCRLLTRLLAEFLSLQRSACFRSLSGRDGGMSGSCPELASSAFLNEVIDSVLGFWDAEGREGCEELRALKAIDCGFLSLGLD